MHQNDHPTKSGPTKNHSSCTSAKQERMKVHLSSRKNKRSSQKREKARLKKKNLVVWKKGRGLDTEWPHRSPYLSICLSSIFLPWPCTVGWNDMKWAHSIRRRKPLSHAWAPKRVSERASERMSAAERARAKRAVQSKQTSEQCKRTSERMSQWPITNVKKKGITVFSQAHAWRTDAFQIHYRVIFLSCSIRNIHCG